MEAVRRPPCGRSGWPWQAMAMAMAAMGPKKRGLLLLPGKRTKKYGKIHHFQWINQLFRLGHFSSS